MKKLFLALLFVLPLVFTSCSRDEPALPVTPVPPAAEPVKINEVYSRGDTAQADWIELYNSSTSSVDISGYKIYDSGGQSGSKVKKAIPAGTTIAAKGYFVITVDDTTATGFGLSSSGEKVWLEKAGGTIIDSVDFPALGVDSSYGRRGDGAANWEIIFPATKGVTNGAANTVPVVMNEIFSRGADPNFDFVEIYNPNAMAVDLSGYKIYDGGGNAGTKPKFELPAGTSIPANGYYVIVVDVADPWGFGLGSGGDEVWFENAGGIVIDHQVVPAMPVATTSYCRIPDGSANWVISNTITKGASNQP
ncbi:MAG: lamin tail domain-containing protein [Ignavibacteriaceae bacterium]|nr:lamin tail domain-containing protein [Ignavibacteriaceae bacterium]